MRAAIGGPGLIAQMRDLDPDRVDELVDVYRAHNEPLHATLEAFDGILELLAELRPPRATGSGSSPRSASPPSSSRSTASRCSRELTEVLVGAEDTERHKPDPDPLLEALAARRRARTRPPTSATRRSTSGPARRRARSPSPSAGAASTRTSGSSPRSPTRSSTTPEELLDARLRPPTSPASTSCGGWSTYHSLPLPRPRRPGDPGRDLRRALRRARRRSRRRTPSSSRRTRRPSASARRRRSASRRSRT